MNKFISLLIALPFVNWAQCDLTFLRSNSRLGFNTQEFVHPFGGPNQAFCENFNAIPNEGKVLLFWSGNASSNNDLFSIEKSSDGLSFETVSNIKASETTEELVNYSETDYQPLKGTSFYRIKQIDKEGKTSYSNLITVKNQNGITEDNKPVSVPISKKEKTKQVLVLILDDSGIEHYSKLKIKNKHNHLYASHSQSKLNSGTYLVIASSNNSLYSQKLIIK